MMIGGGAGGGADICGAGGIGAGGIDGTGIGGIDGTDIGAIGWGGIEICGGAPGIGSVCIKPGDIG